MHRPSANEILKNNESYYSLVVAVAKRARKIAEDAEERGDMLEEKPVQMAVEELARGAFKIVEEEGIGSKIE